MRNLELNKSKLWYIEPTGKTEIIDDDGYFTGEYETGYGEPKEVRLHLYPATGEVLDLSFGKDANIDMVTSSTTRYLEKNTILFLEKPTSNYDYTYDYSVGEILESLNQFQYGLKGRS